MPRGLRARKLSGPPSIRNPLTSLGEDGAAEARPALDEHDLGARAQALEAQGGGEAGDPAADDDDAAHARAASHGAARSSITSTSVAMYRGSSFSAGGRSSRTPSPSATARALTSMS